MSEPKDESFKVVDRRLFTETGEFRKDVAEQQERELASTPAAKVDGATAVQGPDQKPFRPDRLPKIDTPRGWIKDRAPLRN